MVSLTRTSDAPSLHGGKSRPPRAPQDVRMPSKTARRGRRHGPCAGRRRQKRRKHRPLGIAEIGCVRQALARKRRGRRASTSGFASDTLPTPAMLAAHPIAKLFAHRCVTLTLRASRPTRVLVPVRAQSSGRLAGGQSRMPALRRLPRASALPRSAASRHSRPASRWSRPRPPRPSAYILARLFCACASSCSADSCQRRTASRSSRASPACPVA